MDEGGGGEGEERKGKRAGKLDWLLSELMRPDLCAQEILARPKISPILTNT